MKELTLRPLVLVWMQAMAAEGVLAQAVQPAVPQPPATAAAPAEQRRMGLREAVQAQRSAPRDGQELLPERRLSAQEHAELRQQLMRWSSQQRGGASAGR